MAGNEKDAVTSGDTFEASAMHDGAPVLSRDKLIVRKMTALFMAIGLFQMGLGVFIAMMNGASDKPLTGAAFPATVAFMAIFGVAMCVAGIAFGVLRTVVTKKAVHVKYGLWGPTIPLENIESAKVVDYDWTEFGGWGIRIGRNHSRAYVPKNGPCVELVYRDGGTTKRVLVGAENAASTVTAINQARGGARIADDVLASRERDRALEERALEEAEESDSEARAATGK